MTKPRTDAVRTLVDLALVAEAITRAIDDVDRLMRCLTVAEARTIYTLLRLCRRAQAELERRRVKHAVGLAFVTWATQKGIPVDIVEKARELVRKSVGTHLKPATRADIIARDGTGRTRGEPVVQSMMESEAIIQTAMRLEKRKTRAVDAFLDALDGKHNLLGMRTADRLATREKRFERRLILPNKEEARKMAKKMDNIVDERERDWLHSRELLDLLRKAEHPTLRAMYKVQRDDPVDSLAEMASWVGQTEPWIRTLIARERAKRLDAAR